MGFQSNNSIPFKFRDEWIHELLFNRVYLPYEIPYLHVSGDLILMPSEDWTLLIKLTNSSALVRHNLYRSMLIQVVLGHFK